MGPILILKTGETAREVQASFGDYDRWFTDAMADQRLEFVVCDATRSEIPATDRFSGIIVTGSARSVCRPEPWMVRLSALLRRSGDLRIPVLCVCFGCQILARAHGGDVGLNPSGWEIGAVDVELTEAARADALFDGAMTPLPVLATHEDRVDTLPRGAVLLAGNASTPVQAFRIGERCWGVQFHPEGSRGILETLIRLRAMRLEEDARQQGRHVDGEVDRLLTGVRRFDTRPQQRLLDNFVGLCRNAVTPED